jgi:hypothetical protein
LGLWRAVTVTTSCSGLQGATESQDPADRRVGTRVCGCRRAVDAPCPSRTVRGLHAEVGRPCIRQRHKRLESEAATPHGLQQVT